MNMREKVLARRLFILKAVQAGGTTVKKLSEAMGISKTTVKRHIHNIGNIHWQDDVLYYGERL